jgi:hypothetical protein
LRSIEYLPGPVAHKTTGPHDANILIEVDHICHALGVGHRPEMVTYKCRAQRVHREKKRERPRLESNNKREPNEELHENCDHGRERGERRAFRGHVTDGAREIHQLAPAEDHEQDHQQRTCETSTSSSFLCSKSVYRMKMDPLLLPDMPHPAW